MALREWQLLPAEIKNQEVENYYKILSQKRGSLFLKRAFDIIVSLVLLLLLLPLFAIISLVIVIESPGGAFFLQERVTSYGRHFKIIKFRTMAVGSDKSGPHVTVKDDCRITKTGSFLRKTRLDEIPQLLNVLRGDMSFVGTRPEVPEYVCRYTPEMMATLLLPAGITSNASIMYKDESILLNNATDVDEVYVNKVLPEKMVYNLDYINRFSLWTDIQIMWRTVMAVCGKSYESELLTKHKDENGQTVERKEVKL